LRGQGSSDKAARNERKEGSALSQVAFLGLSSSCEELQSVYDYTKGDVATSGALLKTGRGATISP
jgi:hypothetical protein